MTPPVERRQYYIWLDVARAGAAAIVLVGHLRAYVFNDFDTLEHASIAWKAFYFLTSLQHQAVVVFFVLSGFLISKSISEQAGAGRWSWHRYLVKRLSRLWIVLLPALVLTFVWDRLGMQFTGAALYTGAFNVINHSTPFGPLSFTLPTFIGNIFFLQSIAVVPFGTDTPLWSLANEFWYYIVFPLFFFGLTTTYRMTVRVGLFATAIALCVLLLPAQVALFGVWLMGYAAYLLHRRLVRADANVIRRLGLVAGIIFAAVLIASRSIKLNDVVQDYITGIAFAAVVALIAGLDTWWFVRSPATRFADFSYTLYVVHFPFLAFVTSAVLSNRRVAPGAHGLMTFVMLFIAALAYAYLVALVFERNTAKIQAHLFARIDRWHMFGPRVAWALRRDRGSRSLS